MRKKHDKNIKNQGKRYLLFFAVIFILTFLFLNLYFSQSLTALYAQFINENKKAAVEYLKKIKSFPSFDNQLSSFENIYGVNIKNEVFQDDLQLNLKIKKLEQILQKNPESRDVLYSLYQLYLEKGDRKTAEKYLDLTKEVDPNI